MKKMLLVLAMLALPAMVSAEAVKWGIKGDCADCHTMHNSEQGQPVAVFGLEATKTSTPQQNLLRMDCIACHAQDTTKTVELAGGSIVPQVYHDDAAGDLAGGNFKYVAELDDRKGHNVRDLMAQDAANLNNAPGDIRNSSTQGHNFENFTCAGAKGCHGTRSQTVSQTTVPGTIPVFDEDNPQPANTYYKDNGDETYNITIGRVGIAAISGAHHNSQDGKKDPSQMVTAADAVHDGAHVAASYRFLRGLKGWGNEAVRWENVNSTSHNEYFGIKAAVAPGCGSCHINGTDASAGNSGKLTTDSTIKIPNQSMSGFCSTCHGNFHSSGGGDISSNGVSGAFLRHPSDYVIPNDGEYAAYTTYDITAPVARQTLAASSNKVVPGSDMVMCLSCHAAHGTEHDGMLRFNYHSMTENMGMKAGGFETVAAAQAAGGCLACHTTKGVLPQNRPSLTEEPASSPE